MAEHQHEGGARVAATRTNGDLGPEHTAKEQRVGEGEFHGIPLQSPERRAGLMEAPLASGGGGGGAGLPTPPSIQARAAPSSAASSPRGTYTGDRVTGRPRGLLQEGSPLRASARSPNAAGLQTFGHQYMPFAAGFSAMAGEAPVYRSARLHAVNPTAAVSEDTAYLYTLDSGAETPATRAANPNKSAEHVRNTAAGTQQGGFMGKVFKPIK